MSHQTHHHKKKTEDTALEEVPPADPVPEETESGKQRISSTGEEVELSKEDFRRLKLIS